MRFLRVLALSGLATAAASGSSTAQPSPGSAKLPPVRLLKPVDRTASESFMAVSAARALPEGRVLINDISGRRLVLFDSSLTSFTVVADTTSATANAYASRMAGLIPWRADSTLFVDPQTLSMLVIDGNGKVARVMSIPRPDDAGSLIGGPNGTPGLDAQGRLVYRANVGFRMAGPPRGASGGGGAGFAPSFPDTVPLVRLTLATRKLDTVAFLKIVKVNMTMNRDENGRVTMSSTLNPMQVVDDWAVMPDGRIAIVRGKDYHVDWIDADGKLTPQGRLSFAWRKMDDSAKVAFLDSTRIAIEKVRERQQASMRAGGTPGGPMMGGAPEGAGGAGSPMIVMRIDGGGPGGGPGGGGDGGPRRDVNPANMQLPPITMVQPSEMPDYAPAFGAGATRADGDGNLWIRTSLVMNGGSVYDVVNGHGELVDRIQVPAGRVIAGFGTGGVVYMGVREAGATRLERARRP